MQVTCPACKKKLQSKSDLSGKSVKCPCGHAFVAPRSVAHATTAATATAPVTASRPVASQATSKIAVTCTCGKTLQAPAAAAGKAVKCPCGQVVKVPAATAPAKRVPVAAVATPAVAVPAVAASAVARRPASQSVGAASAAPNPFGDISDDEWKSMVQTHAPRQVESSQPKEKSAATKMLDEARKETGQGDNLAMDSAIGFLNKSRGTLLFAGILSLIRVGIDYWYSMSFVETLAATGEEPEAIAIITFAVQVFCGIGAAVAVLFIIMAFLVVLLPMTCAITALVLFTLIELLQLILNPFSLLNIRAWIFRISIFGSLIQGVNNAAYYKHLKAEEKAAKKQR